jgi:CDP-4-dehydro-6-deoxyglucose reductase, E1
MTKYPLMKGNITNNDLSSIINFLNEDGVKLTQGNQVKKFEKQWSEWLGVKHSVFVNSGASANLISISLLKYYFPNGGEVIVPPLTWSSDVISIIRNGFTPVFVDISMRTLAINPRLLENKITEKTKCIFLTHAQGYNGLNEEILDIVKEKNIWLIEDVCESHGAQYNNKKLGCFGNLSNFSFYYAHHLSTIEGGMICTDNDDYNDLLRAFRSHGLVREMPRKTSREKWAHENNTLNPEFIFAVPGFNMRSTEINAVLGINQLLRIDDNIGLRNKNNIKFLSGLNSNIYHVDFDLNGQSNYAFNLIFKEKDKNKRDILEKKMTSANIEFRRGSAGGGNQVRQPYLKNILKNTTPEDFPICDHIHFYGYYIGNYPELDAQSIDYILDVIHDF